MASKVGLDGKTVSEPKAPEGEVVSQEWQYGGAQRSMRSVWTGVLLKGARVPCCHRAPFGGRGSGFGV